MGLPVAMLGREGLFNVPVRRAGSGLQGHAEAFRGSSMILHFGRYRSVHRNPFALTPSNRRPGFEPRWGRIR